MVASARTLKGDRASAEQPLLRMLNAVGATAADRATAAEALVGVYLETRRPVEALHAAFVQASTPQDDTRAEYGSTRMQWCVYCESLDLPYLLDGGLTDADLDAYLAKYPTSTGPPISVFREANRKMTAPDMVRYSQAVRAARHGAYDKAQALYAGLGITWRAARMEKLATLSARTANTRLDPAARLDARFQMATYLADNPERILFNDLLWRGYQSMAVTDDERKPAGAADRALKDAQEERWQASRLFGEIASDPATPGPIARQAVLKLLDCLVRINTNRFGRDDEIKASVARWSLWLKKHPAR
jgi:hypothetical protein